MQRQAVKSSNLASVGYDPQTGTLEIEFNDRAVYQYFSVPANLYADLMNAPSLGTFFDSKIKKGGFRFNKVS